MGIVKDVLNMVGLGSPRKKSGSKMTRLKSQERKLNKKLEEERIAKRVKAKRKRLGLY